MTRRSLACAVALLMPGISAAQAARWSVDVGSSRTKYADSISATAFSVTPTFVDPTSHLWLSGSATLAQLAGAQSNSGALNASLFSGRQRGVFGEIQGTAGGSNHSDGSHTAQFLGAARVHVDALSRGAWLGAGAGEALDIKWRSVRQADVGAWVASDSASLVVSVAPTMVDDTIRYADANVAAHRDFATWALDGTLGVRGGNQLPSLPANHKVWGSIGATYWTSDRVGIVASGGTYPVDFTQGFPGGRFLSLAVRLRSRFDLTHVAVEPPLPTAEVRSFSVARIPDGRQRVRVFAPGAHSVDVMGDFTQWTPVSLVSDARGWWSITLPIESGTHEVNVRVDGGSWIAPPGLATHEDEFGGIVALLVVPE